MNWGTVAIEIIFNLQFHEVFDQLDHIIQITQLKMCWSDEILIPEGLTLELELLD